jgi:hypothetical protein
MTDTPRQPWTREQLLLALRLYCQTPFGKLHQRNPEIMLLASKLGRTPSAVAMKACNFASLDPRLSQRVKGLGNVSTADRHLWEEFLRNPEAMAAATESTAQRLLGKRITDTGPSPLPEGPTESFRTIRARRVQSFFRAAVLSSYNFRCALTGLAIPELLNASHIIPWSENVMRRADPRNGLCLNALHDRAFDRGLIAFDEEYRVIVSPLVAKSKNDTYATQALGSIAGRRLLLPERFEPDMSALVWHHKHVSSRSKASPFLLSLDSGSPPDSCGDKLRRNDG